MMQLQQKVKCIPPALMQFTVGLLCPIIETFSTFFDTLTSEDNVTSVVTLIRVLLVRLAST